MYFRRRPPDRQPLALGRNSRTNLEVRGPFGDEVTYPKFQKSCKLEIRLFSETRFGETGSQKVAHHFSAQFRLVETPSIAIWDCFLFTARAWRVYMRRTNDLWDASIYKSAGPPLGGATRLRGCAACLLSTVPWSLSPELRICSVRADK